MINPIVRQPLLGLLRPRMRRIGILGLVFFLATPLLASDLRKTPIVRAVEQARPSVVNIRGEKTVGGGIQSTGAASGSRRVNGMGTGVVIDSRGYIVTNHHVIEGVRQIQVTLASGSQYYGKLIARDMTTDLAIIKIDTGKSLPVISVGTAKDLMPGEPVVAVGNAYGYEHTVTKGIVSALHRTVQVSDAQNYDDLIQTDASINPGNSGGPLLNIDGEMIGINVAVRAGAQGIGFAIPVDKVLEVAAQLLASQQIKEMWIGVALKSEPDGGLAVDTVENDSPASLAGLQTGDVISGIDDITVRRALDFQRGLLARRPGDTVTLSIQRDQTPLSVDLTLGNSSERIADTADTAWEALGLDLETMPRAQFELLKTRYRGGLTVKSVRADGPAARQGIQTGDILVGMHVWETVSKENVAYVLNRADFSKFDPIKFFIVRGNETLYGYMTVAMIETYRSQ